MVAEREFLHPFQDEELDLSDLLEIDLFHYLTGQLWTSSGFGVSLEIGVDSMPDLMARARWR